MVSATCADAATLASHIALVARSALTPGRIANEPDKRRSVSGILCSASGRPVHWSSSRRRLVAHSSTEAEYIFADTASRDLICLRNLAAQLRVPLATRPPTLRDDDKPVVKYRHGRIIVDNRLDVALHPDNRVAVDIGHARGWTKRTKHMDVRCVSFTSSHISKLGGALVDRGRRKWQRREPAPLPTQFLPARRGLLPQFVHATVQCRVPARPRRHLGGGEPGCWDVGSARPCLRVSVGGRPCSHVWDPFGRSLPA
jgi:hypothetical protein